MTLPAYRDLPLVPGTTWRTAWGVFGEGDQLGTLNLLTPELRRSALSLPRDGEVVNLDHPLDIPLSILEHRRPYTHTIFEIMPGYLDETIDNLAPQLSSQWDALRHVRSPVGFYGATPDAEALAVGGALGIDQTARHGILGRGVLLDVERYIASQGERLAPDVRREIPATVLDEVVAFQGVELRTGDIVIIRFGVDALIHEVRSGVREHMEYVAPGLAQEDETLGWLWDKHVAAVCADNIAVEVTPPRTPASRLHPAMIGLLGLTLGELFDLTGLAETATRHNRYDFLFVAKPLFIPGGVGSPANAMAVF